MIFLIHLEQDIHLGQSESTCNVTRTSSTQSVLLLVGTPYYLSTVLIIDAMTTAGVDLSFKVMHACGGLAQQSAEFGSSSWHFANHCDFVKTCK